MERRNFLAFLAALPFVRRFAMPKEPPPKIWAGMWVWPTGSSRLSGKFVPFDVVERYRDGRLIERYVEWNLDA